MSLIFPMTEEYGIYCRDESRSVGRADSISFPRTEEEVRGILRETAAVGIPVTVQGGRTGLAAAAVPEEGHILNLSRMNRFLGMRQDKDRYYLRVQPGVVLSVLRKCIEDRNIPTAGWDEASLAAFAAFAKDREYFFPTDPTETSATIGGMTACNASGARTFRYGSARDHVKGLRAVLADGRTAALGRGQVRARGRQLLLPTEEGDLLRLTLPTYQMPETKNASGYYIRDDMDAVDLFTGSDGTLAVLTEIELELLPLPACIWGVSCFFGSETAAIDYTIRARGELREAAALEYFDGAALEILRRQRESSSTFAALPPVDEKAHCCVYTELHCETEEAALEALYRLGGILTACGGREEDTWTARTASDRETLQFFRHAVPESVNMLIDQRKKRDPAITKLAADMSVPDSRLGEVMDFYRRSTAEAGLQTAVWGHIGNNHLHVNILPESGAEYRRGKALFQEWARVITAMGGAVSAEHGVGKLKRDYLAVMYGEAHVREMAALKAQLDPGFRLGRGNLFPADILEKEGGR